MQFGNGIGHEQVIHDRLALILIYKMELGGHLGR